MKIAILIGARVKSTRLPRKVLRKIEGKSLIEHLIERVKLARIPQSIVICTSTHPKDKILIDIAEKEGVSWFAGSEDDVLRRFIDASKFVKADVIVRVTGDNPLTDATYIDKTIESHIRGNAEYTYVEGLPLGTKPEVISVDALEKCHALAYNPEYSEYMTLYFRDSGVFRVEKLVADPEVTRPNYRLTVDTPEDLKLMREVYKRLYTKNRIFGLREVIRLLDANPNLASINANIKQREVKLEVIGKKLKVIV